MNTTSYIVVVYKYFNLTVPNYPSLQIVKTPPNQSLINFNI